MKKISLENFIEERIAENRNLFTKEELKIIKKHPKCIRKIYLLGAMNGRTCYHQNDCRIKT